MSAPLTPLMLDAKREYVTHLTEVLAVPVLNSMLALYDASGRSFVKFQEALRGVNGWNAMIVQQRSRDIETEHDYLANLIAACCVSYTKVLGSIRLSAKSNVRVELPQTAAFVHSVYIHVAKELYYDPGVLFGNANRLARVHIVRDAINAAVRRHVPIGELLKVYLDPGTVDDEPQPEPEPEQHEQHEPDMDYSQHQHQPMQMMQPMPMMMPQQYMQPVVVQPPPPPPQPMPQQPMPQPPPQQQQQPQHEDHQITVPEQAQFFPTTAQDDSLDDLFQTAAEPPTNPAYRQVMPML